MLQEVVVLLLFHGTSDLLLLKKIFLEHEPAALICFDTGCIWFDSAFDSADDPVNYSARNIEVLHQMSEIMLPAVIFCDC